MRESIGGGRPSGAPRRLSRRRFLVGGSAAVVGALAAGRRPPPARAVGRFPSAEAFDADVATSWFDLSLELVRDTPGFSPPVASRAFGYAGLALYEALVPGMEGFRSLGTILPELPKLPAAGRNMAYDWPLVANAALSRILQRLFPTAPASGKDRMRLLESTWERRLGSRLPPGVVARSVGRGERVAEAIYEWSRSDGGHEGFADNFPTYEPPTGSGAWVPTPPGFLPALQPFWGSNRCLAIAEGASCPPEDHPPYSEDPGSAFAAEGLETYEAVNGLTANQEEIARYWSDDPGETPTPPGHSISITTQVLRREDASLALAAEAYAKVGMAVCDAFIACWYRKYVDNLLRPVTYLQRLVDPGWLPILVTPPFPEYPSGHSVQSGAAFEVLTDVFSEPYGFIDHTHDELGFAPRRFASFREAGEEAAISRIYGGIHFRSAIENGLVQGRCVGAAASELIGRA